MEYRREKKAKPKGKVDLLSDQVKLYFCEQRPGPIYETFDSRCKYAPATTTRAEFLNPPCYDLDRKDPHVRKELYRQKVIKEMIEEIEREDSVPPPVEPYCSTYDDLHSVPGFKVQDLVPEGEDEMHLKYPLYASFPITYWTDKLFSDTRDKIRLQGMTKIKDINSPFKRSYAFSKPLDERLDGKEEG